MNKKLIVIVFLLWSLTYCAFGQANQWGPFDPGALRNDGSNASSAATVRDNLGLGTMAVATSTDYVATDTFTAHTSATGTAVHGLGTMAAEAATDYVATDTFTGHTGATGSSVHGLGTISTFASTDYVATSSLAERLDTANASFSEDIDVAGDVGAATLGITGHSTLTTASATTIQSKTFFAEGAADNPASSTAYLYGISAGHNASTDLSWLNSNGASGVGRDLGIFTGGVERIRVKDAGGITVCPTTSAAATAGTIYFSSSDNHFYGYDGTGWKQLDN